MSNQNLFFSKKGVNLLWAACMLNTYIFGPSMSYSLFLFSWLYAYSICKYISSLKNIYLFIQTSFLKSQMICIEMYSYFPQAYSWGGVIRAPPPVTVKSMVIRGYSSPNGCWTPLPSERKKNKVPWLNSWIRSWYFCIFNRAFSIYTLQLVTFNVLFQKILNPTFNFKLTIACVENAVIKKHSGFKIKLFIIAQSRLFIFVFPIILVFFLWPINYNLQHIIKKFTF